VPLWDGTPLPDRTVLLHSEQGLGDTIQFSRYAAAVGAGGRVIMEVPRALRRLMTGLPGVDRLVVENDPLPPFDVHCPMMSLPLAFGTTADTIPPPSVLSGFGTPPVLPESRGPRIGIREATEKRWRFWVPGDPNLSTPDRASRPSRR